LDSVDSTCDLGVVLDSKLNFTSYIDSFFVKASRTLGCIRRISKEFRDPYTLKTLYNSFVRSHLDYEKCRVEPILRHAFEENRGYSEKCFEIGVAFARMEYTTSVLSKVQVD
jgi:hypothetical protein